MHVQINEYVVHISSRLLFGPIEEKDLGICSFSYVDTVIKVFNVYSDKRKHEGRPGN